MGKKNYGTVTKKMVLHRKLLNFVLLWKKNYGTMGKSYGTRVNYSSLKNLFVREGMTYLKFI